MYNCLATKFTVFKMLFDATNQLTIIHQGVLQLRTWETDGPEVVKHHSRRAGVDDVAEAKVRDAIQERENVGSRFLHC